MPSISMEKTVRILMLEDSALDAELAEAELTAAGVAHSAERVEERETFAASLQRGCPDLILSDFSLPGFDGQSALSIAQEFCPDVPFLFLSGAIGEEVAIESLKRGATDYVLKQKLERLAPAVRRALAEARQRLERKQAEEELARRARELTVLNDDLRQFAYAASHDLQEPLRTISLFSKMLSTRYKGSFDAQADEYLGYIESAARHMTALLEDLLIYVRIPAQERDRECVDLNRVVDETLLLFQATLEETKGKVTKEQLPVVSYNAAQLGLVLQNLISNALKYRGSEPPLVRIEAFRRQNEFVVSVNDNGIGFDPDYAEQVFGLFKRLNNRDFPGTGLGLAICKRIVEGYGGRIWAESQLDHGATFFFSIPIPLEMPWEAVETAALHEHRDGGSRASLSRQAG